jgi:predicted DNA-binding WGR domain protein
LGPDKFGSAKITGSVFERLNPATRCSPNRTVGGQFLCRGRSQDPLDLTTIMKFVNRSAHLDSQIELDAPTVSRNRKMMKEAAGPEQLRFLVLERREHAVRTARYYVLSVEPTLFAEVSLVRQWGRIGSRGRRLVELHGTPQLAVEALDKWLARKKRRKYCLRP